MQLKDLQSAIEYKIIPENMLINNLKYKKGFTLIELLITISIIGVLTTIGVISFSGAQKQSRDSVRMSKATVISESLEKYYQANGIYPSCNELTQEPNKVSAEILKDIDPDSLTAPGANKGTNSITCSSVSISTYYYDTADSDGSEYTLTYIKEQTNQPEVINSRYRMGITYSLTTIAGTGGSVSGGGNYRENSNVTITATASTGYTFNSWSGTGCSGLASHTVSVTTNLSCTAIFTPNNYTIALNTSGSGSYINCAAENATCTFTGTSNVRYGAYSSWNYKYGITSIACTNANFGDPIPGYVKSCQYQEPVSVSGGGSYAFGTSRTITASPSGSFDSWTGGVGCSGTYSHSFTLSTNTTCTANFSNHTVDLPTPPPAPAAPSISAAFVSNNAVLTVNAVSCSSGTAEYKIRYLRQKYSSDSGWTAWTAWSTTRSMTQVAQQGNNHAFEVVAHCNLGGSYSLDSATASTNIIMDIGTPAAPTYAGPGSFSSDVSQVVNFISYCPSNTDLVNGSFVSNLSSTENIWGPHPFGYNDYWTNWEGYTLTATYWGTYQCQTSFRASPVSPQGVAQVPVYSN